MILKQCLLINNPSYKAHRKMTPKGIVVHSTGANNKTLKRYVQPVKGQSNYDTIKADLGNNLFGNDWNRNSCKVSVHAFIGVNAKGTVETYQTLPWDICCWGCGNGSKGSYNYGPAKIQFEICEDNLKDKNYFEKAFKEAVEFCAYICKLYKLDVSTITSHRESHSKGYASNHGDCDYWLERYNRNMDWFRNEVKKLLTGNKPTPTPKPTPNKVDVIYQTWDDVKNKWLPNVKNNSDYAGIYKHDICCVYANLSKGDCWYRVHTKGGKWLPEVKNRSDYAGIYNKPIDGFMIKTNTGKKIMYQAHLRRLNKWLPIVSGYNTASGNGYAGVIGQEIDAIKIWLS